MLGMRGHLVQKPRPLPAVQVSVYEVPLACPAARNLGCGSAAKPVLVALEKKKLVQEAWLDHQGTTLARVEKGRQSRRGRHPDPFGCGRSRNIFAGAYHLDYA